MRIDPVAYCRAASLSAAEGVPSGPCASNLAVDSLDEKANEAKNSSIQRELQDLELLLLQPSKCNAELLSELLADCFVKLDSSGQTLTKEQLTNAFGPDLAEVTVTKLRVRLLGPRVALITYRALLQSQPPVHTLRMSIWEHGQRRWQMVFHQHSVVNTTE